MFSSKVFFVSGICTSVFLFLFAYLFLYSSPCFPSVVFLCVARLSSNEKIKTRPCTHLYDDTQRTIKNTSTFDIWSSSGVEERSKIKKIKIK